MNNFSSRVLLGSDEQGELAAYFQTENASSLRNGHESKGKSWMDFMGLNRRGVVPKAIFAILMLFFLLNVVITFANWRSILTSTWVEKTHLEETNANFSVQLKQLQTKLDGNFSNRLEKIRLEFDTDLTNAQGKTRKILREQKIRMDSTQNNSTVTLNLTRTKIQDLERKLANVDVQISNVASNSSGTSSNLSSGIKLIDDKVSRLRERIDFFNRQLESHQSQTHGENGTGNSNGSNFENLKPETIPRLEFTQEVWREGKTGLVLAQEISPQQGFQDRAQEIKSKLEQLKTQPGRFDIEDRKILFEILYNSSSKSGVQRTDVCGGSFNFSAPLIFRYEKLSSGQISSAQPCVWLIWANEASRIKLNLIHLNGDLKIYTNLTAVIHHSPVKNWMTDDFFGEEVVDSNIIVAVFTPSPETSSDFMELGLQIDVLRPQSSEQVSVTATVLRVTSSQRSVSNALAPFSTTYSDNERQFFLLYPSLGEKVRITVQEVTTEANYDYLQLFKYDNSTQDFKLLRTFHGTLSSYYLSGHFDGFKNQPMVMYFHTDGSTTHEGFTASVQSVSV